MSNTYTNKAVLAAAIAVALMGAGQVAASGNRELVRAELQRGVAHVAGELIVQYRDGVTAGERSRALGRVAGEREQTLIRGRDRTDRGGDLELVSTRGFASTQAAIDALSADPAVEFAEPNWIVQHQAVSNDTHYTNGNLWGMYGDNSSPANAFGSRAAEAWARTPDCSNVVVGIIDEGFMFTHEDLAANAFTNPGEIAGNNVDDDGNGYVDDVHGWDFDGRNSSTFDGADDDHGTHVAGTIGAVGGNGKGVAGVCWSVKLLNAKFLGRRGGTSANAILAVDYFSDLKLRHNLNLVATNNSWGGGGFSQGLQDAITRAEQADILFIAAAGNSATDNDATASYPSNYPNANVIAVASTTSTGGLSSFSQWGATTVDLGAPGSGIYSTVPVKSGKNVVSGYANFSGTSMATPHVTGSAAYYAARHPGATGAQIKAAILGSTIPTPALAGKVLSNGRLNIEGF